MVHAPEARIILKVISDCLNEELWSLLKLDIINMDDKHISPVLVTEIERDGRVLYEKI